MGIRPHSIGQDVCYRACKMSGICHFNLSISDVESPFHQANFSVKRRKLRFSLGGREHVLHSSQNVVRSLVQIELSSTNRRT